MNHSGIHYSTANVGPNNAASSWRQVMSALNMAGSIQRLGTKPMTISVWHYKFAGAHLNFWDASALHFVRSQADCNESPCDRYSVFHTRAPGITVMQGGRTATLNEKDCLLLNIGEPFEVRCTVNTRITGLSLPGELVNLWAPSPHDKTCVPLTRQSAWGCALCSTMSALTPETVENLWVPENEVIDHIGMLLSLALGKPSPIRSYKASLLQRFRHTMREHLHESSFRPARLAALHEVSQRTLYNVFASAKSSFSAELLMLRLKKARHLLDDPRYDKKSIGEIANLVGFLYTSHFVTRFHGVHGFTPAAYRQLRQLKDRS